MEDTNGEYWDWDGLVTVEHREGDGLTIILTS